VTSVKLDDADFATVTNLVTNATQASYVLSTVLGNKARVSISIWIFTENTDMDFVNETLSFAANSIKFDIMIQAWPFEAAANKLWLMTSQNAPTAGAVGCGNNNQGVDGSGNLRFSQIQINSTVLYGRFLEYASIDGRKKSLEVKSVAQTANQVTVAIVVPFFFETAIVDPDFSVLLANEDDNNDKCKNSNNVSRNVIIIVCCCVVGIAIVGAVGLLTYKKYRRSIRRKHQRKLYDL